jgi:chemotaxis protein MotB
VAVPLATKPSAGDSEDTDDPNMKRRTGKEVIEEELLEAQAKKEQSEFEKAEAVLRQALQSMPELKELADSVKIDQTPEGLRIQLIDQDKLSMFPKGGSRLEENARKLLGQVSNAIRGLPNKLSLSGHTDSVPYQTVTGYTNWELSADRANASRKALIESGIQPDRIAQVVGKADKDHLFPNEPNSPQNRRISIVLQRTSPIPTATRVPPPKPAPQQKAEQTPPAPKGPATSPPPIPGTLGPAAPRVIDPPPPRRP